MWRMETTAASLSPETKELMAETKLTLVMRLKAEVRQLTVQTEGLLRLRSYLMSSKFHEDPTVQARDVLLRLEEAMMDGQDARGL